MTHEQRSIWGLWLLSGLLLAAVVTSILWAVTVPIEMAQTEAPPTGRLARPIGKTRLVRQSLSPPVDLAAIWGVDVRRPVFDTPSPRRGVRSQAVKAPASSTLTLRAKLMAIAIEPGRSYAIFMDEKNQIQVKTTGQDISGAAVSVIKPDRVIVDFRGRAVSLDLKKKQ